MTEPIRLPLFTGGEYYSDNYHDGDNDDNYNDNDNDNGDNNDPQASSIHAWHTVSTFQGRRGVLLSNPKDGNENEEKDEEDEKRLKCNNLSPESRQPHQSLNAQVPF